MSDDSRFPRGLVVFPRPVPPAVRRARLAFAVLAMVAGSAVVWPVYPRFAGAFPLVAGLPLSLAWVVGWLLVMFAGLVALFRVDERHGGVARPPDAEADEG